MPFLGPSDNSAQLWQQYLLLSQDQIDSTTSGYVNVIYILNEPPYTRYYWDGAQLSRGQAITNDTTNPNSGVSLSPTAVIDLVDQAKNRANHTGWDKVVTIAKTSNYTAVLTDFQQHTVVLFDSASATTLTLPTNASVPIAVGAKIWALKVGAGNVSVAGAGGVTVLSSESLTSSTLNSLFECWKIGPNLWSVSKGPAGTAAGTPPATVQAPTFTVNPVITYSSTIAGSTMTCSDGTTDVTSTKTKVWGFTDPTGPFSGNIIRAGATVTTNTYDTDAQDINSQIWCDVTATTAFGSTTVRALGPTIIAAAPTPSPAPAPNTTTAGPRISSFTPSGSITATTGQTISGLSFSGSGTKITINAGINGVIIEDCDISSTTASCIVCQGSNVTIRYCNLHDSYRGILLNSSSNVTIQYCTFNNFSDGTSNEYPERHAIENDYNNGPTLIDGNVFTGSTYNTDVVSNFQTSRVTLTNNTFNVDIAWGSAAAFTIGDGTNPAAPGRDNYIAFNTITQTGGVPAGVFGSEANTIIEYNCFKAGIQAYNYNGNLFNGVTIRKNVINIGASYVPNTTIINGWSTNVNGTNCGLMPV